MNSGIVSSLRFRWVKDVCVLRCNLLRALLDLFPVSFICHCGKLVSWCFKPSQPQRIISGLRETFVKRYIVERTNKAELRPEEQSEKSEELPGEFME